MRILHTADWHLGAVLHGVSLIDDQREMIGGLIQTVKREQIDTVVIAGDLFDHAVARPDAITLYNDAMTALCRDCGAAVLLCAGNHDGAARLAACSALLRDAGLYIAGKLTAPVQPVILGNTAFFLLPYFNAEEVRRFYPEEQIRSYSDAMGVLTAQMHRDFIPGKRNVLVAHCFVGGAEVSESDRAAQVGGSNQVAAAVFQGFDYVALGHLHRAQQIGGKIRYSGSPLKYSFAEVKHEKSFTLLDTETMEISTLPTVMGRELRVLSGEFEALLTAGQTDPRLEDFLQITLTDAPPTMEKVALFRELYPNLLQLLGREDGTDAKLGSLTALELNQLLPGDIVRHFYEDITGGELDEEQLGWFLDAAAQLDREVAQ